MEDFYRKKQQISARPGGGCQRAASPPQSRGFAIKGPKRSGGCLSAQNLTFGAYIGWGRICSFAWSRCERDYVISWLDTPAAVRTADRKICCPGKCAAALAGFFHRFSFQEFPPIFRICRNFFINKSHKNRIASCIFFGMAL